MKHGFFLSAAILLMTSMNVTAQMSNSKPERFTGYLFAYFEGSGENREALRFAVSDDAVNWHALNGNKAILGSDTISESGGIRDPHILRGERGEFLIVATDMHSFDRKQGWGKNPGIVLLRSTDLINWSHTSINLSRTYPERFGDAHWVWAPQTIYDRKAGKYMIYFTLSREGKEGLATYYAYANDDFTAFEGEPQVLFEAKYGSIDNDIIVAEDGTFHNFYKGNTKDAEGKEIKNGICQATSKSLTGSYTEDFKYLDSYANVRTNVEGSSVFRLNDQDVKEIEVDGQKVRAPWVLMYDLYSSGRYEYQLSPDLWYFTPQPMSFTKNFHPRHGSVISITEAEKYRVIGHWGVTDDK